MSGLETGDILAGNPEGAAPTFLLVENSTGDASATATHLATKGSASSGYVPDTERMGAKTSIQRSETGIWDDASGNSYVKWDGAPVAVNLVAGSGVATSLSKLCYSCTQTNN